MHSELIHTLEQQSTTFLHSLDQDPLLGKVIGGDASQPEYVQFLGATYHYLRWSGFLLARTAQGLRQSGRCPGLQAAVDVKADEEGPHDTWVLQDLRSCGVNPELVKGSPVPTAVRAYVEWSLALAEAGSPAFLGAAYTLEFISMQRAKKAARNLRARRAIPNIERALRFLDGHGAADAGHIAELEGALASVEDAEDRADVDISARVMRRLYLRFFANEAQ